MNNLINKYQAYAQTRPNRARALLGAGALVLLLLVCILVASIVQKDDSGQPPPPTTSQAPTAQVRITKDGFVPATLVVKQGTKVIWTNTDKKTHQIQANPHPTGDSLPGLKSEILNNKQTYEYTANQPGTYHYHDHLTPTTNGTFEVQE